MAQFLRGKQAGIQKDFSDGLVGTSDSQFGSGQVYVFGQRRVLVIFQFPRKASARFLQFCADKLISVDSKNEISIFSLETKQTLVTYAPPSHVTALLTDPSLDYAFIGLQSGDIIAYDLDRETMTPFRVPNLWAQRNPRARLCPVVALSFSPRDIGKILVGYPEGAVIFTFKQNMPQKYFEYEVPPGALGGNSEVPHRELRKPRLTKALWHPNGLFMVTVHDDNSLVFWDTKDGRKIMARTMQDVNVDEPGVRPERPVSVSGFAALKNTITQVAWCVKQNGDDSGLLIAGGRTGSDPKGLTFMDLGPSPYYQSSSWQALASFFEHPKQQVNIPTPPTAEVVDFCLIPRASPYFAGAHDPIAVIGLLSSGEVITMSFPSGHPITPTNMVHPFLSFVHPFVNRITLASIDRSAWLGLKEKRAQGPKFLLGGAEGKKAMKRFEQRNVVTTAHVDGTIRLWDTGNDDEIENGDVIQVDLARAVGRVSDIEVTEMSMSSSTGEISVGLSTGEVVIFRWGNNAKFGTEEPAGTNAGPEKMTRITHRTDPGLKTGLLPLSLLDMQQGPVTAIKHSHVGFVAAGFHGGSLAIMDLRGPALIHSAHLTEFLKSNKRGSFLKPRSTEEARPEWPTSIEFGVMTLEGDDYSSICCFVGTSRGNLATFKILPGSDGAYKASFVGSTQLDDKVINIIPLDADAGGLALATPNAVGGLRHGSKINGAVLGVTVSGCRMFKPATSKGAHKSWDDFMCDSASIVKTEGRGYSLVGLFGDGNARAFSIPGLKEIGCTNVGHIVDMRRLSDSVISPTGNVLAWTTPSEVGLFNVWGSGFGLRVADTFHRQPSDDQLFNPEALIPPRPTITNIQWISGTQYVTPADMDDLSPDRPPSKRMQEQMKLDDQERRRTAREERVSSAHQAHQPQGSQEGYLSYMQRQVTDRTQQLGSSSDHMDRLEESSSNWARDVNKYVQNQKRKAVFGGFGF